MTVENRLTTSASAKPKPSQASCPTICQHASAPDYGLPKKQENLLHLHENPRFRRPTNNHQRQTRSEDSPNSAGVVIDLIRAAKIALTAKSRGTLISMPSYAFKHPPVQAPDSQARQWTEDWIAANGTISPFYFFGLSHEHTNKPR